MLGRMIIFVVGRNSIRIVMLKLTTLLGLLIGVWVIIGLYRLIFIGMKRDALFYVVVALLFSPIVALLVYLLDHSERT